MELNRSNVLTTLDAERAKPLSYGYFSNTLGDLERAITEDKVTLKVFYTSLDCVLNSSCERRFVTKEGIFALFYPTDEQLNEERY